MALLTVGSSGKDVRALHRWLNAALRLRPRTNSTNTVSQDLVLNIIRFRQLNHLRPLRPIVDAKFWMMLGKSLGARAWSLDPESSRFLLPFFCNDRRMLGISRHVCYARCVSTFKLFNVQSKSGLDSVISNLLKDDEIVDVRWIAYILATTYHECRFRLIEESEKLRTGKKYNEEVVFNGSDGKTYKNRYFGRGFVQLTWQANYRKVGEMLGRGDELERFPETVLQFDTAYKILTKGMRTGLFTGRKLSHYIHGEQCDYYNARRIVNALDHAADIAQVALDLEAVLRGSSVYCLTAGLDARI